jgi:two-component system sensor histidine kinase KdpD
LPLAGSGEPVGVLGLRARGDKAAPSLDELHLLEALGSQTALALERSELAEEAEAARVHAESERLRSTLLSAVSHDLRSPLAGIMGSASSLLENPALEPDVRRELLQSIYDESVRLNRLVANLLDMSRLRAGTLSVSLEQVAIEEVVGGALERLESALAGRSVEVDIPAGLPLAWLDPTLIEQLVVNLLENSARHTPEGTPIEIRCRSDGQTLVIEVADRGPGIPAGAESDVFAAFYRGPAASAGGGLGLGLAICDGIVRAHSGSISVSRREGGGALFKVELPVGGPPQPGESHG